MGLSIFLYQLSPRDIKIHPNKCKKKLSELREGGREERRKGERLGGRNRRRVTGEGGKQIKREEDRKGGREEGDKSIRKSTFKLRIMSLIMYIF